MKTKILAIALFLVLAVTPAFAQSNMTPNIDNGRAPYNTVPNDTGGTTTDTSRGFDWRWLLPLLAIPVLYFAFRRSDADSTDEYHTQNHSSAISIR